VRGGHYARGIESQATHFTPWRLNTDVANRFCQISAATWRASATAVSRPIIVDVLYIQLMQTAKFDAFWSYAHDDDTKSGGRVIAVAEALQNEFSLVTGDDLEMFLDRKSLKWGDAWRSRIESAIGEVPFFIPIVTPKFLKSEECRREFVKFSGEAKSRGFEALLLPILYIPVPGLKEDSDDQVMALIARTQYFDWTPFRLLGPDDPRVLQALNELALRINELKQEAVTNSLELEVASTGNENAELNIALAEITERFPEWMEAVEFDRIAGLNWSTYRNERVSRANRLEANRAAPGEVLSTLMRLGRELLPIAHDRLEKAITYSRLSIELDPLVVTAIRLIGNHRDQSSRLNALRDGVNEAMLNIEPAEGTAIDWGLDESITRQNKHLEEADNAVQASRSYVIEGNEIVTSWRDKLRELDGDPIIAIN
jgi:hypothetical protein